MEKGIDHLIVQVCSLCERSCIYVLVHDMYIFHTQNNTYIHTYRRSRYVRDTSHYMSSHTRHTRVVPVVF